MYLYAEDIMASISDVLKKSMVFSSLEPADQESLCPLFEKWDLHIGDVITTAGNIAQYFFILEKGTLLLEMEGGKAVVLDTPGDFLAMELLSLKNLYTTTTTVLEEGCVYAVAKEVFLGLIQEDTEAAETIMAAWQEFCDERAPFLRRIEDINIPEIL